MAAVVLLGSPHHAQGSSTTGAPKITRSQGWRQGSRGRQGARVIVRGWDRWKVLENPGPIHYVTQPLSRLGFFCGASHPPGPGVFPLQSSLCEPFIYAVISVYFETSACLWSIMTCMLLNPMANAQAPVSLAHCLH